LAQSSTVGNLRIVDDAGETVGQESAPAGEKLFRLESGVTRFLVGFDYEGTAESEVQIRVMGPSGTILHQDTGSYDAPGGYEIEVDNGDNPFQDQDYVINAYIGPEPYLADSLQLVVGSGSVPGMETSEESASQPELTGNSEPVGQELPPQPVVSELEPDQGEIPGGPSRQVLLLAGLGIVALMAIVLWAGWSAMNRSA
jgi:hypothetical protein